MHHFPASTHTLRDGRTLRLRPARPDDAADLVEIERQIIEEGISNVGANVPTVEARRATVATLEPRRACLVAEHAGQVVGMVELRPLGPTFLNHLRHLSIELHQDWRGAGIGTALIKYSITWAQANEVETLLLGVLDSNPRAKALYARLGFQQTGYLPRFVKRPDGTYVGDTQMAFRIEQE